MASRGDNEPALATEQALAILSTLLDAAFPLGLRKQLDSLGRRFVSDASGPPDIEDRDAFEVALTGVARRWGLAKPGLLPVLERVVLSRWRPKGFKPKNRRRSGEIADTSFEPPTLGRLRVTIEWFPDASPEFPEQPGEPVSGAYERWVVPSLTFTEATTALGAALRKV